LIGEPRDDLILHVEEIDERLVEPLGPEMIAGLGVDKLDIDPHAPRFALDRAFERIPDAKLLADLFGVNILPFESKGGVTRDHEGTAEAREICGETLGDAVREIVLARIAGEISEWKDHDG
jgi:hypothetical protein